jgi:hypothetical protein
VQRPKPHPTATQRLAVRTGHAHQLFGNIVAGEHAQPFDQLHDQAARRRRHVCPERLHACQRRSDMGDGFTNKSLKSVLHPAAIIRAERRNGTIKLHARRQRIAALAQHRHPGTLPQQSRRQAAIEIQREIRVGRIRQPPCPRCQLA